MSSLLRTDDVFDSQLTFVQEQSVTSPGSFLQPVLRATQIFKKIMSHPKAFLLFIPVARLFNPKVEDSQVEAIFKEVHERGCDVFIRNLSKAVMQCIPYPNTRDSTLTRPQLLFDFFYAFSAGKSPIEDDRQEYVHVVKLFHEFCHLMVPGFIRSTGVDVMKIAADAAREQNPVEAERLEAMLSTPPKIGPVLKAQTAGASEIAVYGDSGSEFEERAFGGRVLPWWNASFPYSGKVMLVRRKFEDIPPTQGNQSLFRISDDYIHDFLKTLHSWGDNSELPDFRIPQDKLDLFSAQFFETADEVRDRILGKRKRAADCVGEEDWEESYFGHAPEGASFGLAMSEAQFRLRRETGARF